MKINLCRFLNIFNPSFHISLTVLTVVIALVMTCVGFRIDFVISGVLVLIGYIFLFPLFNYPKYIELKENKEIYYKSPITLPVKRGKGFFKVVGEVHISNITKFTLQQNKIERFLGIAHLIIEGKTTIDAGKHSGRLVPKNSHTIYGIILKNHCNELEAFAKTAIFKRQSSLHNDD